ncbi:UvrD-helicase domain-containing protein [Pseudodesulfovibrio piezophilus]|uniref:DNA 3'-5' helicase n=1 Tax=Pseudodesulfovibrio piezophilus (strain DSM 21447 / JCM 15486 / C1TLV30) TaxID=1322246 RepID=M1WMZ2_PSEP2|nr:UvrD-helicase domain-containing protein [Pseudodesulfovibrio piezophilus]CCH50070.1 putative UvrD/REP helicase [Pseudodesulfovibrio piezophilus C1TLV30]
MSKKIELISASAGSGKTYSLTERFVKSLDEGVRPESVVATTFTKKAAQEIGSRFRSKLFEQGRAEDAQRVFGGYIGTVNAVCGALLKDYAFEVGQSPTLEVVPDGEDAALFRVAAADAVGRKARQIVPLVRSLEIEKWEDIVKGIIDKARANAIDRKMMLESGERSWELLRELMPDPISETEGKKLDTEIVRELKRTIGALPSDGDTSKGTLGAKKDLQAIHRTLSQESIPNWATWAKLSKIKPTSKSAHEVETLHELAGQFLQHPRFHNEVRQLITLLFDCAAEAAGLYQQHKRTLGLIDFTDQEALALKMVEDAAVADQLKERLDMVMVDEFQDTSPIQLALFLKLSKLVDRSVWVGDQKQSIYAFRGSDPALMDAVIDSLGEPETLPNSWRSQSALVDFASEYFAVAFGQLGIPEKRVRLTSKVRSTTPKSPHLKCWRFESKNKPDDRLCLVGGIQSMLADTAAYAILDKTTKKERTLKAGDIAVLCMTNDNCRDVAALLEENGIRAAIPRTGLMKRPEIVLVMAAYRYLLSPEDTLAVAELAKIFGLEDWFSVALQNGMDAVKDLHPMFGRLDDARHELASLTPSEVLDLAIDLSDAGRMALGWDNPALRQANLDALRGHALGYESTCKARRCACTPAGLINYLHQLKGDDADSQAVGVGDDTVQVLTYHRSKGLEWPVVILTDLESGEKGKPFGLSVQSSDAPFDLDDPLAGRWLRYWPWPFGLQKKIEGFSDVVEESDAGRTAFERERRERLRLLYVGMTRARDYMILSARKEGKGAPTAWLDSYTDAGGNRIVSLPNVAGVAEITVGGKTFPIETVCLTPIGEVTQAVAGQNHAPVLPEKVKAHPPARFVPSSDTIDEDNISVEFFELGAPLLIKATDSRVDLGNAVHAFLAVASPEQDEATLRTRAERIVTGLGLKDLTADMLLEMHQRLRTFITTTIDPAGTGEILTEWPIHLKRGLQKGSGWIDMLCRQPDGDVIIDHKTSLGGKDVLEKKAIGYAGQLATYGEALQKATGISGRGMWLHFALAGMMARVNIQG